VEKSDVFNLGTGAGNLFLRLLISPRAYGKTVCIRQRPQLARRSGTAFCRNTKIKSILKWETKRSIEDSVKTLIECIKTGLMDGKR